MSKPTLSRTAAIREARRLVSLSPYGDQYVVYQPWDWTDVEGANTSGQPMPWAAARGRCTEVQALMALHLMGVEADDGLEIDIERARGYGYVALESLVKYVAGEHRC